MTLLQYLHIAAVLLLLTSGQLLFEQAARSSALIESVAGLVRLIGNGPFLGGLFCYGIATVLYIALLQPLPLSRAYPVMAINYVLVPTLSLLRDRSGVPPRLILGLGVLATGLFLVGTQ